MPRHRLLVLALLLPLGAAPLRAQEEEVGRPFWVLTPERVPAALDEAREAVAARDWTAAARALQEVCEHFPEALAPQVGEHYVGARAWAMQLLATMPAVVREEYEALYGRPAEVMLRRGLASEDRAALVEVVRRYEPTRAGFDAILALADRALLRGEPAEARLWLARLRVLHADRASAPEVAQRAALAAARDHAEDGPPPTAEESRAPPPRLPAEARAAWPMMQGDARRSLRASPVTARELVYHVAPEIHERNLDTPPRPLYGGPRGLPQIEEDDWEAEWADFDPVHAVVARGSLVFHDGSRIACHNLYSGEELWHYPDFPERAFRGRTNLSVLFSPVIADGVVYAALESEQDYRPQLLQGVHITYYIPERRLVALDLETGRVLWAHTPETVAAQSGSNPLYKLSIVGPPLVRGDMLFVPAVYSEGTFHNFLLAVDRRTGAFRFATRISIGQQELNLFGRQLQEAAATPIAEADGVLYYGTNQGVIAAVDALLGTPLWLTTYRILDIPKTYLWYEAPRRWPRLDNAAPIVAGDLLLVSPADGREILVLDRGSGRPLWALPWHGGQLGFVVTTLQGADAERMYVSGERGVAALWLRDDPAHGRKAGGIAWVRELGGDRDKLIGRGLLAENGLWIPSTTHLFSLDPESGEVVSRTERYGADADVPVNLVWGDGVLVTAGRDVIGARYDEDEVVALARAAVDAHPDEIAPLLQAADVFRSVGRIGPAIERYKAALARAEERGVTSAAARAREGLHRSLVTRAEQTLESDPGRAPAAFEAAFRAAPDEGTRLRARIKLEDLLARRRDPADREWRLRNLRAIEPGTADAPVDPEHRAAHAWALRRMAVVLLELQQPRDALEVLQKLLESDPGGDEGQRAAIAIRKIVAIWGRKPYEPWELRAHRIFEQALQAGDYPTVEHALLVYGNTLAAERATLALASHLLEQDRAPEAARRLQQFLAEHPDSMRVPAALQLMVRALDAQAAYGAAYAALNRLRQRHGDTMLPDGEGSEVSAADWADAWLARDPYPSMARRAHERTLEGDLELVFRRAFPEVVFVDVPDVLGPRPDALQDAVLVRAGTQIVAVSAGAKAGSDLFRLEFDEEEPQGPLAVVGDKLLAVTDRRVHVFDAATGGEVARRPVPGGGRGIQLLEEHGQVFLVYQERGLLRRIGVAALHPDDGHALWETMIPLQERDERVAPGFTIARDDRLLVVSENPVRLTAVHATSGAIENSVVLDTERNSRVVVPPIPTVDGRLLLGIGTSRRVAGLGWDHSNRVVLVDPSAPQDQAVIWSHVPPSDGEGRYLKSLQLSGNYVVVLDESRGAAVLDAATGAVQRWVPRLPIPGLPESMPHLAPTQPHHDSMLLVLTNPLGDEPARLTGFALPGLEQTFSTPVGDHEREEARVIGSEGLIGIELRPRDATRSRPRIRLFDPARARMVQEITPPTEGLPYLISSVQNGVLVVTTQNLEVFAYAHR